MDKTKYIIRNLNKKDAAIVISAAVISLGILGAVIAFGIEQWRWLVGIGVPVAVDAALIALIVVKIKKSIANAKTIQ